MLVLFLIFLFIIMTDIQWFMPCPTLVSHFFIHTILVFSSFLLHIHCDGAIMRESGKSRLSLFYTTLFDCPSYVYADLCITAWCLNAFSYLVLQIKRRKLSILHTISKYSRRSDAIFSDSSARLPLPLLASWALQPLCTAWAFWPHNVLLLFEITLS